MRLDVLYIHKHTHVGESESKTVDNMVTFNRRDLDFVKFKNTIIKQKNIPTSEKDDYSIDKLTLWLCVIDRDVNTFELTQDNFARYHSKYISNFEFGSPKNEHEMICYVGWKPVKPKVLSTIRKENKGQLSHLQVYLQMNNVIDQKYVAQVCSTYHNWKTQFVSPVASVQCKNEACIEINVEEFSNDPEIMLKIGCYNDQCGKPRWGAVNTVKLSLNDKQNGKNKNGRQSITNNGKRDDYTSQTTSVEENKTDCSGFYVILIAKPCDHSKGYYCANMLRKNTSDRNAFLPFETLDSRHGIYIAQIPSSIRHIQLFELSTSNSKHSKVKKTPIERTFECIPPRNGYYKQYEWSIPISSYNGASCMIIDISAVSKSFFTKHVWDRENIGQRYTTALSCIMDYVLSRTHLVADNHNVDSEAKNEDEFGNNMTFAECLHVISRMVEFLRLRKVDLQIDLAPFFLDTPNRDRKSLRYLITHAEKDSSKDKSNEAALQRLICCLILTLLIESINFNKLIRVVKYIKAFKKLAQSCKADLHSMCNKIACILRSPDNVCAVLDALARKFNHVGNVLSAKEGLEHYCILVLWYNLIHCVWHGHLIEMRQNQGLYHPEMEKWEKQVTISTHLMNQKIETLLCESCTIINLERLHRLLALELGLWIQDDIYRAISLESLVMDAIINDKLMRKSGKFSELIFIVEKLATLSKARIFLTTFQDRLGDQVIIDLEQWHRLIEIIEKKVTTSAVHRSHTDDIFSILRCEYIKTIRNEKHYQFTTLNTKQVSNTLTFLVNNPHFVNEDICSELIKCEAFLLDETFMKQFWHKYLRENKKNANWETDLNNYCTKMLDQSTLDQSQIDWKTVFCLLNTFETYKFEWTILEKAIDLRKARFFSVGLGIEKLLELLTYQGVPVGIVNLLISFAKFQLRNANDVSDMEQLCVQLIDKNLIAGFENILDKCENKMRIFHNFHRCCVDKISQPTYLEYLQMLIRLTEKLYGTCRHLDNIYWEHLTHNMVERHVNVSFTDNLPPNNCDKLEINISLKKNNHNDIKRYLNQLTKRMKHVSNCSHNLTFGKQVSKPEIDHECKIYCEHYSDSASDSESTSSDVYYMKNPLVLLLCISKYGVNVNYGNEKITYLDLQGPKCDMKTQTDLWQNKFGFDLISNSSNICNNNSENDNDKKIDDYNCQLTKHEMDIEIARVRLKLLESKDYDGLIFIFSGHGYEDGIVTSDGKLVSMTQIKQEFSANKISTFKDKPKIYIIDACRSKKPKLPMTQDLIYVSTKGSQDADFKFYHPYINTLEIFGNTPDYSVLDLGATEGGVLLSAMTKHLSRYVDKLNNSNHSRKSKESKHNSKVKKKILTFQQLLIPIRRDMHKQMGANHALHESNTMMFELFLQMKQSTTASH